MSFDLFKSKSTANTSYTDNSTNVNAEDNAVSAVGSVVAREGSTIFGEGATIYNDLSADVVARALDSVDAAALLQTQVAMNGITGASRTADLVVTGANEMVANNAKLAGQSIDTALAFGQLASGSLTTAGTNRTYAIAGMIGAACLAAAFLFRRKKT
jgi:hypothetical protein